MSASTSIQYGRPQPAIVRLASEGEGADHVLSGVMIERGFKAAITPSVLP